MKCLSGCEQGIGGDNDGGRSNDDNGHDYGSGDDGIIEGVVNVALGW